MDRREHWSLRLEDGVLVASFPNGTVLSPATAETLLDRWGDRLTDDDVDAVVVTVRTSRICSDACRHVLRAAAQIGADQGVNRWAVVAERSKRGYLKRTIDVAGLDVESFNDAETAVAWGSGKPLSVV